MHKVLILYRFLITEWTKLFTDVFFIAHLIDYSEKLLCALEFPLTFSPPSVVIDCKITPKVKSGNRGKTNVTW